MDSIGIPDSIERGSVEEREWLNTWIKLINIRFKLQNELGYVGCKDPADGCFVQCLNRYIPEYILREGGPPCTVPARNNMGIHNVLVIDDKDVGKALSDVKTLEKSLEGISAAAADRVKANEDMRNVKDHVYIMDRVEEHIRNPLKAMDYGPLVTAAVVVELDAYHKEIRKSLSNRSSLRAVVDANPPSYS